MNIVVCPYCQNGFRDNVGECPVCGKHFDYANWPQEAYSPIGQAPRLTIQWADNTWFPSTTDFVIGRQPGINGLILDFPSVSREHVHVKLVAGVWIVENLGKNFTVNGHEIPDKSFALQTGDTIEITPFSLEVSVEYNKPLSAFKQCKGILQNSGVIPLDDESVIRIGSDKASCQIIIDGISLIHAMIYFQQDTESWWIVDINSAHGTKVNGKPIHNEKLFQGDKISICGIDIVFELTRLIVGFSARTGIEVSINNVTVQRNNDYILNKINCNIHPGEFVGVLGPSGCGKSSLIQRLVGLGSFDEGKILVNSIPYLDRKEDIQAITAYVPQDVALHEDLTLAEEIQVFSKLHLREEEVTNNRILSILKLVGLDSKWKTLEGKSTRIGDLSGGEKRRASIALELLRNPQLFILDEPTAGLDPASETEIMHYLRRIANQDKTVICSTHIMGNITLFDKVLFLSKGHQVFYGTPWELMNYFKVDSPLELYRHFGQGDKDEQISEACKNAQKYRQSVLFKKYQSADSFSQEIPSKNDKISSVRLIGGYLKRQVFEYLCFRNSKKKVKAFWQSFLFIQTILLPILVALVLKLACADFFYHEHKKLFFFASIAVFWFGLNSNIRELVRNRTPWRCLERLEHVPLFAYLSAKVLWTLLICFIQLLLFSVCIWGIPSFPLEEILDPNARQTVIEFKFSYFFILYLVSLLGAWTSLAVSAKCKKENAAIGFLPIILIPVLFFSQPIILDDTFGDYWPRHVNNCKCEDCKNNPVEAPSNGQYNWFAVRFERFMPCDKPELVLMKIDNKQIKTKDWLFFILQTGAYMFITLTLMALWQNKNEREWEGR